MERVVLRRGASLEQAGTYLVGGGERREEPHPLVGKYGPERLVRAFSATTRFHDDRIDVREDVTWTWYESRPASIDFTFWRRVRRGTSARVRTLEPRGNRLVTLPVTPDEPPTATDPVKEEWWY